MMRGIQRWAALLALLLAPMAMAEVWTVGPGGALTQTANDATANEPTAATDGALLTSVCSVRVVVSADSTRTLSGAGTLKFWYYDTTIARWVLNATVSVSVTNSSRRDQVTEDLPVLNRFGRIYVEADTVTVSAGGLTVRIYTNKC